MENETITTEDEQDVTSMAPFYREDIRQWAAEKHAKGVKQVRITSLLERLTAAHGDTLVGTAEAAEILRVERPRIAKWRRSGVIPPPLADTASGPIWLRSQILDALPEADARRRAKRSDAA